MTDRPMNDHPATFDRRLILQGAMAAAATLVPLPAVATPETMAAAMRQVLGGAKVQPGKVKIDISPLAENGNSVPLTILVDSPMTAADHVRTIYVFSPENPLPDVARFHLTPRAGRAQVKTSIRLATSQKVEVVAVMSDGTTWGSAAEVIVTLSACFDAG